MSIGKFCTFLIFFDFFLMDFVVVVVGPCCFRK